MHHRGWGLGTRLQNVDTCVSREPKYRMVKPLSAGCVNTVVACWILITSDYVSQVAQRKLTRTRTRNRKLTLCGLTTCIANLQSIWNFPEKSHALKTNAKAIHPELVHSCQQMHPGTNEHTHRPYLRDHFASLPDGKSARMSISCCVYGCKWRGMKGSSAWFFWFSEAPNLMRL